MEYSILLKVELCDTILSHYINEIGNEELENGFKDFPLPKQIESAKGIINAVRVYPELQELDFVTDQESELDWVVINLDVIEQIYKLIFNV